MLVNLSFHLSSSNLYINNPWLTFLHLSMFLSHVCCLLSHVCCRLSLGCLVLVARAKNIVTFRGNFCNTFAAPGLLFCHVPVWKGHKYNTIILTVIIVVTSIFDKFPSPLMSYMLNAQCNFSSGDPRRDTLMAVINSYIGESIHSLIDIIYYLRWK